MGEYEAVKAVAAAWPYVGFIEECFSDPEV